MRRPVDGARMAEGAAVSAFDTGCCSRCGKRTLVGPLHGEKGGAITCIPCGIEVHAEIRRSQRREKLRNRLFQAELNSLKRKDEEMFAAEDELSLELLQDTLRLVHPDRHPPEREEMARRVMQELLALKPFVLPKAKPRDVSPIVAPRANCPSVTRPATTELLARYHYPCEVCKHTVPTNYCGICRDRFDRIQAADAERWEERRARANARQRERRARRKSWRRPATCASCGAEFTGRRKDARYCSPACRQRAHRHAVTDTKRTSAGKLLSRNGTSEAAA